MYRGGHLLIIYLYEAHVITCAHLIFAEIQYEVMISYKWKDSEGFATELEQYLQSNNMRVYRDESRNKGGQVISEQWKQAICTSRVFVPILSMHYPEGTPDEEFFYNKDVAHKPIVPVVMKGFVIPSHYGLKDTLQIRIGEDFEENKQYLKEILDGVEDKLKGLQSIKQELGMNIIP